MALSSFGTAAAPDIAARGPTVLPTHPRLMHFIVIPKYTTIKGLKVGNVRFYAAKATRRGARAGVFTNPLVYG
jgi:hypothetical protein